MLEDEEKEEEQEEEEEEKTEDEDVLKCRDCEALYESTADTRRIQNKLGYFLCPKCLTDQRANAERAAKKAPEKPKKAPAPAPAAPAPAAPKPAAPAPKK